MKFRNEQHEALTFIKMAQDALADKGVSKREIDEYLADAKRSYRRRLKLSIQKAETFANCDETVIDLSDEYGGRCTHLYKVTAPSREYMKDYIQSEIRTIDSPYDCTGQWFTTDIRFAHMQGDTYLVKHSMSQDV